MTRCRSTSALGHLRATVPLALTLALAALSAAPARTTDGGLPELRDLKDFLADPDRYVRSDDVDVEQDMKPRAKACFADREARPKAQQALRDTLERRWLDGEPGPGLTFPQFESLAEVCPPFQENRADLIGLLARPEAPRSWRESELRRWLRRQRAAAPTAPWAARLLTPELSRLPDARVDRFAFLVDLFAGASVDLKAVRSYFVVAAWDKATPSEMEAYVDRLGSLEKPAGGAGRVFIEPNECLLVRRILGTRLLRDIAVTDWPTVGTALLPLADATDGGPGPFLDRVVAALQVDPALRVRDGLVAVLLKLTQATAKHEKPIAVRARLHPGDAPDWFAWLFEVKVLPEIHHADPTDLAREASFAELKGFAAGGRFADVSGAVQNWYKADQAARDRLFREILRPNAEGHPEAVIAPAVRGAYTAPHRALLASAALAMGDLLGPAWRGDDAPARLDLAVKIYVGLIDPKRDPPALARHLGSDLRGGEGQGDEGAALLERILRLAIDRLDQPGPLDDRVLMLLDPLAAHLEECRAAGGAIARSRPLLVLDERVRDAVLRALADLPDRPRPGGLVDADRAAIHRFVDRLRLALRLGRLAGRALGPGHDWVESARHGLRDRVFGLGAGAAAPDGATVAFRAALMAALDPVLRSCLEGEGYAEEAERFFSELDVRLAAVPGFLRALRGGNGRDWPYLAWVKVPPGAPADVAKRRLSRLFEAMAADVDLEAEEAVADLARADLEARWPGASVWGIAPAEWFARQSWNRNAGVRIWWRLLAGELPRPGEDWALKAIADRAVSELGRPAPAGPSDPWGFARWAAEVVTAAERRHSEFLDAAGRKLPWRATLSVGRNGAKPFVFEPLPAEADHRLVDGRLRLALVLALLDRYRRETAGSAEERDEHLIQLARVATLLPNHPDNSRLETAALVKCHEARRAVYAALDEARRAGPPVDRHLALVRAMMRLHVAGRSGPPVEPPFQRVVEEIRATSLPDDSVRFRLSDILEEMGGLREAIGQAPAGDLARARADADRWLDALLPPDWRQADEILINRTFLERLDALTADRLASLLKLEVALARLLAHHQKAAVLDPAGAAADLERIVRAYRLVDYTIWYSRPSFEPSVYFRELPASPQGHWYPALVVLAWGGPDLQRPALALLDRLEPQDRALASELRRAIFQRNETAMVTLASILEKPDAAGLLSFRHFHETRTLNLRLLAETRRPHELSAEALVRGAFDGVGVNLMVAGAGAGLSDEAVWSRLFGARPGVETPPESLKRFGSRPLLLKLNNIDAAVLLAARCVSERRLPEPLRMGADRFLVEGNRGLLQCAETPESVLTIAQEIADRAGRQRIERYRKFYDDALTRSGSDGQPVLSGGFREAVAAPFYRRNIQRQREFVTTAIDAWREATRGRAGARDGADQLRLGRALRHDLGPLAVALARGKEGHQPGQPYLWQPVDMLDHEDDVREARPDAFFELVAWWRTLARGDDPESIRGMLRAAGSADDDALAGIYRRRCEREAAAQTRRLESLDRELRGAVPDSPDRSAWEAVELAWSRGPTVREELARLLACSRKYNRWAETAGPSIGLAVPEAAGRKKWEALRPLWLPVADDRSESGWEIPANDGAEWRRKGAAPAYEFLLVLRWLSGRRVPPRVRDWVIRDAAADRVREWFRRADAAARRPARDVLLGQYDYRLFPPGSTPDAPPRVAPVLARLVWAANPPAPGDFPKFVAGKDALMCDLLELITACDAPDPAVDWFVFGAHAFPPFTALLPEPDPRTGSVRVVLDRPDSRVNGLFDRLDNVCGDKEKRARLRDAVFWYQIDAMSADGRLEPRAAGWSTWIKPGLESAKPAAQPHPAPVRKVDGLAPEYEETAVPDNAWRRIIWSIVDDLRKPGVVDGLGPLAVGVDQPAGWVLAFGTDELVRELAATLGREVVAARGSQGVRVVVTRVDPGASVEMVLRRGARDLAPPRTVRVNGPWPPWFASRVIPDPSDPGTWICLSIAALGVLVLGWRLRRSWNDPVRGVAPRVWASLMAMAGLGLGLVTWGSGPVAAPGPRRGGVVEILPARGPDLSWEAKEFLVESCAGAFRALGATAERFSPWADGDGWPRRWFSAARAFLGVADAPEIGPTREDVAVAGLRYRLVPLDRLSPAGHADEGLIAAGETTTEAFRKQLEQHEAVVVAGPTGSALPPPGPATTFRLAFLTGDYGGLIAPPVPGRDTPQVDLSVWLPGPTRDADAGRGLTARGRLLRAAAGSRHVVTPVAVRNEVHVTSLPSTHASFADGSRIEILDRFGEKPHDLAQASRELWGNPTVWARQFGRDLGLLCARLFGGGAPATSASTLRAPALWWGWILVGAIATAPACALSQLQRRGRSWSGWMRFLVRFGIDLVRLVLTVTVVALTLTAMYSAVAPWLWTYGRPMVALRLGVGAAAATVLVPAVSMALALAASRIWPGDSLGSALEDRGPTVSASARAFFQRLAGLVLLGAAMACFVAIPVRDSGLGFCMLLPSAPGAAVAAGLGLWLLAASCLLAAPALTAGGTGRAGGAGSRIDSLDLRR